MSEIDDVVDPRPRGQGDNRHEVAVLDVVGERSAGPVERVRRVATDAEDAQRATHRSLSIGPVHTGRVHYDSIGNDILQPHCVQAVC